MQLVIEGKGEGWAEILAKSLKEYKDTSSFTVISFNKQELLKFHKLNKDISCNILVVFSGMRAISIAKANGFDGISIHYTALNPFVYMRARRNNLKVTIFTLNSKFLARIYARFYPNIHITTDNPDKLLNLISKLPLNMTT
jgi:hypothetical protein